MSTANQVLPEASATELSPGAAFAPAGTQEIVVFMGPASKGPLNSPRLLGAQDIAGLTGSFGTGPTVKRAAYFAAKVAAPFVFVRTANGTVAAFKSTATVAKDSSSNFTSTLSGTPIDGNDVLVTFTLGGTTGTGPISYTVSLNGGETTGSVQNLATATTIVVNGVTVTLGSGHTVTAGDTIAWWTIPAPASVQPQTFSGTGSSAITVTGTPEDAYEVAFQVIDPGTIGIAGITFIYSLDANASSPTWTSKTALSTATTFDLVDGPISQEPTGLTLNFGAGTLAAGDTLTFSTTAPTYDSAGATAATSALLAWNGAWTWVRFVGLSNESTIAGLDSIVSAWASSNHPAWGVADARDHGSTETLPAWSARVQAEFGPYTSTHVGVSAGMERVVDPINGRHNRISAMDACTPRAIGWPIFMDWAQYDQGPLDASVSITDANNNVVEHNAFTDPGLNAMGFITLRTWPGAAGVFPTKAALLGPDTDVKRVPLRRVMNVGLELLQEINQLQAVKSLRVYRSGDPKIPQGFAAGDIVLADLNKIRRLGNAIFTAGLVSTGYVSGYVWTVQQTPISLGGGSYQIKDSLQITALIYVDKADGTAQFVSATVDVLSTKPS